MGLFNKLKSALTKTSSKISNSIDNLLIKKRLDEETLEELESILISTDIGVQMSSYIIDLLRKRKFNREVTSEEIKHDLALIIQEILDHEDHTFHIQENKLNVILVCGVNGNGKTTTIGKMASSYIAGGKKVAIAACDTFRAAAVEQIRIWSNNAGAVLFSGEKKCDPASIAHKAVSESLVQNIDILFIDTAGRLHTHTSLMDQLAKIIRVIKKIDTTAPHHSLLVIDGATGQNAINQVTEFKSIADISGLIITKLDGTAKAGAVVNIVHKFSLPVYFIGVGESKDDLKPFNTVDFSKALLDDNSLID